MNLLFVVVLFSCNFCSAFDPQTASINSILSAIVSQETTCSDIIQSFLGRIDQFDRRGPKIGAIVNVVPTAMQEAQLLDEQFRRTQKVRGKMHCVPIIVKDNIDVAGVPTTNGVNAFSYQIPLIDSDVVAKLRDAGAIPIAKANMSPFADKEAWGNSQIAGLIRNPFAPTYTTYGSSGGSAAAAASMFAVVSLGTETGVSVNLPSSAANLVGLRPPVDDISQEGVMPNDQHQDVVGPMAKRAEDVIITYDVMKRNSSETILDSEVLNSNGLQGLKINIFQFFTYGETEVPGKGFYKVDREILGLFNNMSANMVEGGAKVVNKTLDVRQAFSVVMPMFQQSTSACQRDVRDRYFGNSTRFGARAPFHSVQHVVSSRLLPPYYQTIWERMLNRSPDDPSCEDEQQAYLVSARERLVNTLINPLLQGADVAIWPAMPEFPAQLHVDAYTRDWGSKINPPVNLILLGSWSAFPSINIPMGFSKPKPGATQGLPIGAFAISTPENLPKLLRLAYAYQAKYGVTRLPTAVNTTAIPQKPLFFVRNGK